MAKSNIINDQIQSQNSTNLFSSKSADWSYTKFSTYINQFNTECPLISEEQEENINQNEQNQDSKKEKKIILESKDLDEKCEYTNIEDIQDVDDPFEPFSLQKAALLICGIIPRNGGNLDEILERLGSGFVIHSEIVDTPKGSGLGNTSILAAACTKAILEFFGIKFTENDLFNDVLAIEQIMGTGGGWQDQVGGVSKGINLVTSEKGIKQNIVKRRLNISDNTMKQLKERFCLIYTGERRLQRNLLKDVYLVLFAHMVDLFDYFAQKNF